MTKHVCSMVGILVCGVVLALTGGSSGASASSGGVVVRSFPRLAQGSSPGSPGTGAKGSAPARGHNACYAEPGLTVPCPVGALDSATGYIVTNGSDRFAVTITEITRRNGFHVRTTVLGPSEVRQVAFLPSGGADGTAVYLASPSPHRVRVTFDRSNGSHDYLCKVPVNRTINRYRRAQDARCTWTGGYGWIATFQNYSNFPLSFNEWYRGQWHGETIIAPQQTIQLPLQAGGNFWVGAKGPSGHPPINLTVTNYEQATHFNELWVRTGATTHHSQIRVYNPSLVTNISPYVVQIWAAQFGPGSDPGNWKTLEPGRSLVFHPDPGEILHARKEFGLGQVARVTITHAGGGGRERYHLNAGSPSDPCFQTMTTFLPRWSEVTLKNIGHRTATLWATINPCLPAPTIDAVTLPPEHSAQLKLKHAWKILYLTENFQYTTIEATNWREG